MNSIAEIQLKYSTIKRKKLKIINSDNAFKAFLRHWNEDTIELYEEFKIMLLNKANEVLGIYTLSQGGISATLVDMRLLFAVVLKSAATSIILAHNHPSGNLKPSEADKQLFRKINKAAKLLDITVHDNLIITKVDYYSFNR
jgi:DNA repair protein RadC